MPYGACVWATGVAKNPLIKELQVGRINKCSRLLFYCDLIDIYMYSVALFIFRMLMNYFCMITTMVAFNYIMKYHIQDGFIITIHITHSSHFLLYLYLLVVVYLL